MYFIGIPIFQAEAPETIYPENSLARPGVVDKAAHGT
jgi:hypothetical protein